MFPDIPLTRPVDPVDPFKSGSESRVQPNTASLLGLAIDEADSLCRLHFPPQTRLGGAKPTDVLSLSKSQRAATCKTRSEQCPA